MTQTQKCIICEKEFVPTDKRHKCCTPACSNKNWIRNNKARKDASRRAWHHNNWERSLANNRRWRTNNRDGTRAIHRRRRARKNNAPQDGSADNFKLADMCIYCGATEHLSADHIIPVSKQGPHTASNLVTACRSCNTSKKDSALLDWFVRRTMTPLQRTLTVQLLNM